MNVSQSLEALLRIEARIDALKDVRAHLRAEVEDEARRQFADQGAAPTYRVAGVGTASLAGADSWTPSVTEPAVWAGWVLGHHPTEAEVVYRVPGQMPLEAQRAISAGFDSLRDAGVAVRRDVEVRPQILKKLADAAPIIPERATAAGDHPLIADGGEIVPGVVMRRSEPHLAVRFNADARREFTAREVQAAADLVLDPPVAMLADEPAPVE